MTDADQRDAALQLADRLDAAALTATVSASSMRTMVATLNASADWRAQAAAWLKRKVITKRYPTFVLRAEAAAMFAEELEQESGTPRGRALPNVTSTN